MALDKKSFNLRRSGFTIAHMSEDERGAAAVEYAILVGLIILAIVGSLSAISSSFNANFQIISDIFSSAPTGFGSDG